MPNNLYSVVASDPPWEFTTRSEKGEKRSPEVHYPTMSLGELMNIPLHLVTAPDCALFMWATFPTLPQALALGEHWGFTYKTAAFTWLKRTPTDRGWQKGMGYWTMSNAEPCLLFTKGSPKRVAKDVAQIIVDPDLMPLFAPIVAPRRKHSQKPDEFYGRIERLMGDVPRLELFARQTREGWTTLGNEIDGKDINQALKDLEFRLWQPDEAFWHVIKCLYWWGKCLVDDPEARDAPYQSDINKMVVAGRGFAEIFELVPDAEFDRRFDEAQAKGIYLERYHWHIEGEGYFLYHKPDPTKFPMWHEL